MGTHMSITVKDIDQISFLSRINFSDSEKESLTSELNTILTYVDQLNEVDVEGVEPLVSVLDNVPTVFRKDEVRPSFSQEEALKNAPDANSDYFKVPKVIGSQSE